MSNGRRWADVWGGGCFVSLTFTVAVIVKLSSLLFLLFSLSSFSHRNLSSYTIRPEG
jgi:hypothetical protein